MTTEQKMRNVFGPHFHFGNLSRGKLLPLPSAQKKTPAKEPHPRAPHEPQHLDGVFWVTITYFFIELLGGVFYNSLALITDASFMAINVAGQLLVMYTERLSARAPDLRRTFGYERAKVISGLVNGLLIGFVLFYVFRSAYGRLLQPPHVAADKVLLIASLGLAANAYALYRLARHARDISIRGAFLLALNDALGSVGILLSSLIIIYTGYQRADAIASVGIGFLIAYPTYQLIRDSIHILMEGAPAGISIQQVADFVKNNFLETKKIKEVHVWAITPEKTIATIEVRTHTRQYNRDSIKALKRALVDRFGFYRVYIEVYEDGEVKGSY